MEIFCSVPSGGYPITIGRGALSKAGSLFRLDRKVLILTDDGVPRAYAEAIAAAAKAPYIEVVPQGEGSKSFPVYERVLSRMLALGFSRKDCIVSVGGGVPSDLAGFCAATYMRGIDFYTVPTTVLSAVDASIGGKTALNLDGIKNIVGAFYQPKGVLIDPDTFLSLPDRQVSNGLAEAVKMALTFDADLFRLFEKEDDPMARIEEIVARSVDLKRIVVERDEREQNLRRVLNFGHTIAHGIESAAHGTLYHGECVAIGMLPMCAPAVRERLLPVPQKLRLPTDTALDPDEIYAALLHDKKADAETVAVTRVETVGSYVMETVPVSSLRPLIDTVIRKETV